MLAFSLLILGFMLVSHLPILIKNKRDVGAYILSTQLGYELWQGHNPVATGLWFKEWTEPSSPFYKVTVQKAPEIQQLTQYPESKVRVSLAMQWIKQHPWQEIKLMGKKIRLYFLPDNAPGLPGYQNINPLNFTVHALFILALILSVFGKRRARITRNNFLLLTPVLGSLLLTLVFFMGHRWRYYAEPFLILYIVAIAQQVLPTTKPVNNTANPILNF